jgi:CheY-like chemotaxis protein
MAKILIADDYATDRLLLVTLLGYQGHTLLEAAKRTRPQVVVCDLGLPGLDGFGVAAALRQAPETAGVRLIALTGYGREEDRERALAAGFNVHLVKPVDPERLIRVIEGA